MARASANRGRRPRPNARPREQRVARPPAAPQRPSYEDQLFFSRLRNRAKLVFAILAGVFALSFVALGVGTGVSGASPLEVVADIFGSKSGPPSLSEAQKKVDEHPDDPDALLTLANALQTEGETKEAAAVLERYVALQPTDADALRQLATLYGVERDDAQQLANDLRLQSFGGSFSANVFSFPGGSGFMGAVGNDPIDHALTARLGERAAAATDTAAGFSAKQQTVLERLAKAVPDDPEVFLALGQAADGAGDTTAAVAAYQKFLELAPDDSRAKYVQEQLDQLRGATPDVVTG